MDLMQGPLMPAQANISPGFQSFTNATSNGTEFTPASAPTSAVSLPAFLKGLEPLLYNPYVMSSVNWFFFGTILETGRRMWQFLVDKFTAGFVLTAVFDTGDPAYDWLCAYLSKQGIWSSTREFKVTARSSTRTWGINSGSAVEEGEEGHAEYTPFVDQSQVFRFNGTWCQVKRSKGLMGGNDGHDDGSQLVLTLYTRNRAVLDSLVETAYAQYKHKDETNLTIHSTCSCGGWCGSQSKGRRPIDSLILPKGLKRMLLSDTKTFMRSQAWYKEAGIQHKRGYLLYGLPGTGKTSTIHALASELDLHIYNLSLATTGLDDSGLARLISSTPANSLILIEDIDCAFPSRDKKKEMESEIVSELWGAPAEKKSKITLSGLLNVLDGVSSEEGRLLFATTNYVDRLDPALLRPGRMDVKIHYKLSTRYQVIKLFKRFFTITVHLAQTAKSEAAAPETTAADATTTTTDEKKAPSDSMTPPPTPPLTAEPRAPSPTPIIAIAPARPSLIAGDDADDDDDDDEDENCLDIDNDIMPPVLPRATIQHLAEQFANALPTNKYSMAELQGYLLTVRTKPFDAVANVGQWMQEMADEKVRIELKEKEEREEKRKEWLKKKQEEKEKEEKEKAEKAKEKEETKETEKEKEAVESAAAISEEVTEQTPKPEPKEVAPDEPVVAAAASEAPQASTSASTEAEAQPVPRVEAASDEPSTAST